MYKYLFIILKLLISTIATNASSLPSDPQTLRAIRTLRTLRVLPLTVKDKGSTLRDMPSPGIYKQYVEQGIYHLFNRGNDKQKIFRDEKDYRIFLSLLWKNLKINRQGSEPKEKPLSLLCYCLMPNHFHLLVKQTTKTAITDLMKSLVIKYVMYFNKRHQRKGRLFESIFKARRIDDEPYLLHVSRYIHLNSQEIWPQDLSTYPYSSYATYLGRVHNSLLNTEEILSFFHSAQNLSLKDYHSYQAFVEDYKTQGTTLGYQFLG